VCKRTKTIGKLVLGIESAVGSEDVGIYSVCVSPVKPVGFVFKLFVIVSEPMIGWCLVLHPNPYLGWGWPR
jgi:hypothetical protein